MKKIAININISNDAFHQDPSHEFGGILQRIADRLTGDLSLTRLLGEDEPIDFPIFDSNGNRVGRVQIT